MRNYIQNKSSAESAKAKLPTLICVLLLYPYIVGFTTDTDSTSTSETLVGIILGVGSHGIVQRDCSGNVIANTGVPFRDFTASVEHRMNWSRLNLKGGIVSLDETRKEFANEGSNYTYYNEWIYEGITAAYINPSLGAEWKYFGMETGILFFTNQAVKNSSLEMSQIYPSGKIRIGNYESAHFSFSFFNNRPLLSGGNIFDIGMGLGSEENKDLTFWFGLALSTGDTKLFPSLKTTIPLNERLFLDLRGNFAFEAKQFALAAGFQTLF